jgi:mercuric ion transport protein
MADLDLKHTPPRPAWYRVPLLLAGGGAAAAFCAASCCGLPILLGSVGLGSGWLLTLAWIATPHRIALLIAAGVLLVGGAGAMLWRRRVAHCRVDGSSRGVVASAAMIGIMFVGAVLAAIGYVYV